MLPDKLQKKLHKRAEMQLLRSLSEPSGAVDFCSNDYLGFATTPAYIELMHNHALQACQRISGSYHASKGSRLIMGNHGLYPETEERIAKVHKQEAALIYNSGYDANLGFFQAVPQRGDLIFYDALVHASIRDGLRLSQAVAYKFKHNDLEDLKGNYVRYQSGLDPDAVVYVVTEALFSMDGDAPDLKALLDWCEQNQIRCIVDQAHAFGVMGIKGYGLLQGNQSGRAFAEIVTYGKAMGVHGAAILGSKRLIQYLVNFSRALIYTTALPPMAVGMIGAAYMLLEEEGQEAVVALRSLITFFRVQLEVYQLDAHFIPSTSAIQCMLVPGNEKALAIANYLQQEGFQVKAILSPTVPAGSERIRICLHAFNTEVQVAKLLRLIKAKIGT